MPAGDNPGGQLSVIMFELGMITRDPFGLIPDIVQTMAIHPMVVVPSSIQYTDATRSTVTETHGGSIVTKAGRSNRQVQFSGSFGVQSRGLGLYVGTGDQRFQRFYHEIVRLADAVTKGQVDAEKDPFRSPILSLLLKTYNEERSSFFVNYYDFWHNIKFEASATSFRFGKTAKQASSTGQTMYQLQVQECGPIVTGSLGTTLLNALFEALTTWDTINETIKSYTLDAVTTALVDAGGIVVGQFMDSVNAFKAQVDGATAVMNGSSDPTAAIRSNTDDLFPKDSSSSSSGSTGRAPSNPKDDAAREARSVETEAEFGSDSAPNQSGLGRFLGSSDRIANHATDILDAIRASAPPETFETENGAIRWAQVKDDGGMAGLDSIDAQDGIAAVVDAARFQRAVGSLYGMSRQEYASFLTPNGNGGRDPNLAGTTRHVVTEYDTAESIRRQYGVPWHQVLRLNDLLPDEALIAGTVLLIPRERGTGQQTQIEGLPTFGSHAGTAAWGADLFADFRVDASGSLQVARGSDVLIQGIDWILAQFGDELTQLAQEAPPVVRDKAVADRAAAYLASDKRIASVDAVTITSTPDGAMEASASIVAINGGTIDTGQGAR